MGKGISINTSVIIQDEFRTIIKSGNYEKIILDIMNSSKKIFPNEYIHQENQSHGECDFIDKNTEEKYDVKLPLYKKQGKLLGSHNFDYEAWFKSMMDEVAEFSNVINNRGNYIAEELILYKVIKDRLATIKEDENLILFFPFPVVTDDPNSIILRFASDILTFVFDALKNNGEIKSRKIYAIYPCMSNCLTIRFLNERKREYISNQPLKKYINYDISLEIG